MEDENNVTVVSMDKYSLNILLDKGFYAFPKGSRKVNEYFAFYHSGEINYYGKVTEALEVMEEEFEKILGKEYWLLSFPDANPPFKIVKFNKIEKLKAPVIKENLGRGKGQIQGRVYTSFKRLINSKTILDLF